MESAKLRENQSRGDAAQLPRVSYQRFDQVPSEDSERRGGQAFDILFEAALESERHRTQVNKSDLTDT
jgi:hypothetical protein